MSTLKSWPLNSYTNNTWTDLVAGTANGETVKTVIIANKTTAAIQILLRVVDSGGTEKAIILPATLIRALASQQLLVGALNLTGSQKLQMQANAAGLDLYASGVAY